MSVVDAPARRGGRPRSEEADRAIVEATVDALVNDGYAGLSIEGIAARAGVGKATIYRRWKSKAELVVDAIRTHACVDVPLIDTGDARADLVEMLKAVRRSMAGVDGQLMAIFSAERARHPELHEEFERTFVATKRAHLRHLIGAAVERGELPADSDVELLADLGPALLWHHLSLRGGIPRDLPERIVDLVFATA